MSSSQDAWQLREAERREGKRMLGALQQMLKKYTESPCATFEQAEVVTDILMALHGAKEQQNG